MLRRCLGALVLGGFQYSETQYVLCSSGERYLVDFRVGDMFVGEDPAVNELLHFLDVDYGSPQCIHSSVLPVTQDSEEQVVRRNAVTSGPHRLLSGEVYD